MTLYEKWLKQAYNEDGNAIQPLWDMYMPLEQKIYENLLDSKISKINSTVSQLAKKYNMTDEFICGFLDGINEALDTPLDIETLEPESNININIDFEKLYKKMIEFKAEHLYTLEQWENIFDKSKRDILFKQQKLSNTFVRETKIGRNEPCSCGSGKKYKKCCGLK